MPPVGTFVRVMRQPVDSHINTVTAHTRLNISHFSSREGPSYFHITTAQRCKLPVIEWGA
jgi:hypothetical protein